MLETCNSLVDNTSHFTEGRRKQRQREMITILTKSSIEKIVVSNTPYSPKQSKKRLGDDLYFSFF